MILSKKHILPGLILLLLMSLSTVVYAIPRGKLSIIFRPGEQLTTVVDDTRYVDVQLFLSANVQFRAADISCRFSPGNKLLDYTFDNDGTATPNDPGDDIPVIRWGPEWGAPGEYVAVSATGGDYSYNNTTGTLNLTISRLGNVPALGLNGVEYEMLLATVRLKVYNQTLVRDELVTASCTTLDLLDRNGTIVLRPQRLLARLQLRSGYSLTGTVLYQGSRFHTGIAVTCQHEDGTNYGPVLTNSQGKFTMFGGRNSTIREFGEFTCTYSSPNASPSSEFLDAEVLLDLNTPAYNILPVILKGGNVATGAGSEDDIDDADIAVFTANWSPGYVPTAYQNGDVNGDRQVNDADLAIVAANYAPGDNAPVDASHMLFGLATSYADPFPYSQIYYGDNVAGPVTAIGRPFFTRDFWPTLSPDGKLILVTRVDRYDNHMLYKVDAVTGAPRAIHSTLYNDLALAPSWSPDGRRVAYICSEDGDNGGYEFNEGNLCVVNGDDFNLRSVLPLATMSKIYPPAWIGDNKIVFAGTSDNLTCADTLCYYDFERGDVFKLNNVFDGGDIADMPSVVGFDDDDNSATPDIDVLFYRDTSSGNRSIRAAVLTYNDGTESFDVDAFPTVGTHVAVGASTKVDYYNVSPFMDVVYYESETPGGIFKTLDAFNNLNFTGTLAGGWGAPVQHFVEGFAGNATYASGFGGGVNVPWNGSSNTPTVFHAYRATMEWVP